MFSCFLLPTNGSAIYVLIHTCAGIRLMRIIRYAHQYLCTQCFIINGCEHYSLLSHRRQSSLKNAIFIYLWTERMWSARALALNLSKRRNISHICVHVINVSYVLWLNSAILKINSSGARIRKSLRKFRWIWYFDVVSTLLPFRCVWCNVVRWAIMITQIALRLTYKWSELLLPFYWKMYLFPNLTFECSDNDRAKSKH